MLKPTSNTGITLSLLLTVLVWGANNAGTKWLVKDWPPIWTGSTRFLLAGLILLALLRLTKWVGEYGPLTRSQYRQLWLRGGLSLGAYIIVFCWALKLTAASHVALYIGISPIWALLIEQRPRWDWSSVRRYGSALLAFSGVFILFWPALHNSTFNIYGEVCGLLSGIIWANYSHQSRKLADEVSGLEVAANSMWMAGLLLLPVGLIELTVRPQMISLNAPHLGVQLFNILLGGVVPYALWNSALRQWRTSRVMMFNNLIPLSTTTWSYFCLGEPITTTFCTAMILIVTGVLLGQVDWSKIFREPESF